MACSAVQEVVNDDDIIAREDLLQVDEASCELMLEALQEHLRSIEVRINLAY